VILCYISTSVNQTVLQTTRSHDLTSDILPLVVLADNDDDVLTTWLQRRRLTS